ncbi:MAG: hypothetical protein HC941_22470 [Microcoleus sp. SU_5_3]|nr:hypothetical protein [Microcoleus sp. SU_5_3]
MQGKGDRPLLLFHGRRAIALFDIESAIALFSMERSIAMFGNEKVDRNRKLLLNNFNYLRERLIQLLSFQLASFIKYNF